MSIIYHLTSPAAWQQTPDEDYRAPSFLTEGFLHASYAHQVAPVANLFYANEPELIALAIDTDKLRSPYKDEAVGEGEVFPHIYGPLNRSAVQKVLTLTRKQTGEWMFDA